MLLCLLAAVRREFGLGPRQVLTVVNYDDDYCGLVLLPELLSQELDPIADDDTQIAELVRYTDVTLLLEMNVKEAMKIFDDVEADELAVIDSAKSRKVIGFLSESYALRPRDRPGHAGRFWRSHIGDRLLCMDIVSNGVGLARTLRQSSVWRIR